jgi:phenylalanyl-tRNA synthetase alpha chain
MREEVINSKNEALGRIMDADNVRELEQIRIDYLGRSGKLTKIIKGIKHLQSHEKKETGLLINECKSIIASSVSAKKNDLKENARDWFDPTLPGIEPKVGHTHLITQAINDITRIFEGVGFVRRRYREVEWDWFAYTALNFPQDHPARDEMETFQIDASISKKYGKMLLSPHTSSGQAREMLAMGGKPPIRMINITKCYRRESDASHFPQFHQFEGLVIDEGINITHLKGTLSYFVAQYYGPKIKIRLRPHNFKFTEPSFEVDITCTICEGKGCKVCKEGWLEQTGAGMVHPNVLKAGGVDPSKYSGFAWGWGIERALLMKPGLKIKDLRTLYSTDLNFLTQF